MTNTENLSKKEISEGYDKIADRVGLSQKFYKSVMKCSGTVSGKVLDVGCGRGLLINYVSSRCPNADYFGLDISWVLVNETVKRNESVKVIQGDSEFLPYKDGTFDHIFLTEVMEHLQEPVNALKEIARILKPNGTILVTVPNRDWICYDTYFDDRTAFQPIDDKWYSVTEVEGFLTEAGFEVELVGGAETLGQKSGISRFFEKIQIVLNPELNKRMKRMVVKARKSG